MRRQKLPTSKVLLIKEMLICGFPWSKIEKEIPVSPDTISRIYREHKGEIDTARQENADEAISRIRAMAPMAADTIAAIIQNPESFERTRADLAKYVIDQNKKVSGTSDPLAAIRALLNADTNPSE
jgi:hypothetical protein